MVSCQYFDNEAISEKELFEKEVNEIDWRTVDQFPSLATCNTLDDENEKKICFFKSFTNEIKSKLKNENFSKYYSTNKILNIKVTVFPEDGLKFESIIGNDSLKTKQKIDSILVEKLVDFPTVTPATKRGVYVKSEFIIPFKVVN